MCECECVRVRVGEEGCCKSNVYATKSKREQKYIKTKERAGYRSDEI